jgi:methionine-rich copper-binding protein CopC
VTKRTFLLAAVATLALAGAATANAHAFLDHASPRVGSQVKAAPPRLQLWFTQGLVAAFCQVTVSGPAGFGGADAVTPAPNDAQSLVVELRAPTPPGLYTVRWRVLSVDTHVTEGDFTFMVKP